MESNSNGSMASCATPNPIQVLLVEDNPESAALIRAQVGAGKDNLFHVEWKDTLQKAMTRLAKAVIDVILLDLGMPELSGYRTHLAITSVVGKTIPVVILTSDTSMLSRNLTIGQGAASYLLKGRTSSLELKLALQEAVAESKRLKTVSL